MIDAVSSLVLNTSQLRGATEQVASARSYAANPERIQEAPKAPYISPFISVNVYYDRAVLQIRDSETGDVLTQFPAENQLERSRVEAARARSAPEPEHPEVEVKTSSGSSSSGEESVPAPDAVVAPAKTAAPTPQQIDAFSAGAQTADTIGSSGTKVSVEA